MKTCVVIPILSKSVEGLENIPQDVPIFSTGHDPDIQPPPNVKLLEIPQNSSLIFGGTSEARLNFSYYTAWKQKFDVIITVRGNPVKIPQDFVEDHLKALKGEETSNIRSAPRSKWYNTLNSREWFARGFPMELRVNYDWREFPASGKHDIVCHMGLWEGDLDLHAVDFLSEAEKPQQVPEMSNAVVHQHFPLSTTNVAVKIDVLVALYHPSTFFRPYLDMSLRGWSDIWAGYILQRLIGIRGQAASVGNPVIERKVPTVLRRQLREETYGFVASRYFYKWVDASSDIVPESYPRMYKKLSENLLDSTQRVPYFCRRLFTGISRSMLNWAELFLEE